MHLPWHARPFVDLRLFKNKFTHQHFVPLLPNSVFLLLLVIAEPQNISTTMTDIYSTPTSLLPPPFAVIPSLPSMGPCVAPTLAEVALGVGADFAGLTH
eukprot:SAG31_NODE_16294_length_714_cov_6.185366_2_plen_98_part_01